MDEDQPVKPANILNIVAINQGKREETRGTPGAKPLAPQQANALLEDGHHLVDARSAAAFGAGHIKGSYNVQQSSSEFEQRVGWVVPDDAPIVLLTDSDADAQKAVYDMAFIGMDQSVVGYVEGGIDGWMNAGLPVQVTPQLDVYTLHEQMQRNGIRVLDVRGQDEWDDGHIDPAFLMPYTSLAQQLTTPPQFDKLPFAKDDAIAVTCHTGKRSSTAISLMLREGYTTLYNVTGGMEAWGRAKLPMFDAQGQACSL
ncbi:MAG: rhodanese-like domain-containing protein [Gemmatimonadota bacterium]